MDYLLGGNALLPRYRDDGVGKGWLPIARGHCYDFLLWHLASDFPIQSAVWQEKDVLICKSLTL
jgi:hypothetical protein